MSPTIRCRFLFALLCAMLMVLCVSAQAHAQGTPTAKSFLRDPVGDTTGPGPDITGLNADVVGANVVVTLTFAAPISPPFSDRSDELFAIVLFDTDGSTSNPAPEIAFFC